MNGKTTHEPRSYDHKEYTTVDLKVHDKNIGHVCLIPITSDGSVCELSDVFVDSEHRNQGIGAMIVVALLAEAKRLGIQRVQVHVPEEFMHWWSTFGFEVVSKEVHMEVQL